MARRSANEAKASWNALDAPWRTVFQLAWEAYRHGSEPVGAIVVRTDGSIVARGRDHVYEIKGPAGSLPGGPLAHAAVIALSGLDPFARHEELTLMCSLEPCALCVGAAVAATVGLVQFAAADPYAGAARQVPTNADVDRLKLRFDGPLPGPFGLLAAAMRLEPFARLNPQGHVVRRTQERSPRELALAREWASKATLHDAANERMSLPELLPDLWESLCAAASPVVTASIPSASIPSTE